MTFHPLTNAKILIRPFEPSDADEFVRAARAYDMGIFCAVSNRLLGGTGINQLAPHHRYGNIGYWVRQSRQGQGIARQAVALLRDCGFTQLGLFRLEIVMGVGNTASEAVAIAAGATFECRVRNRIFLHDQPLDTYIFTCFSRLNPVTEYTQQVYLK